MSGFAGRCVRQGIGCAACVLRRVAVVEEHADAGSICCELDSTSHIAQFRELIWASALVGNRYRAARRIARIALRTGRVVHKVLPEAVGVIVTTCRRPARERLPRPGA